MPLHRQHGENEVPPVFTDATGSANVQLQADGLHFSLTASGSEFTMGHIHYGAAGQPAGPIVVWLFNAMDDPQSTVNASGVITVDGLEGPFEGDWDGFLAALASGHLNINVHSTTYPAGELRAQIYPQWGATLSAEEETAEVDSDATGSFSMSTDADSAFYSLQGSGGTEQFTMAHIHLAPAGDDGPIVVWLFNAMEEPVASFDVDGDITEGDLEGPVEGDWEAFLSALGNGLLYVNVHSVTYGPGEIRGQIHHTSNFDAPPADVEEPTPPPTPTDVPTEAPTEVPTATPTDVPAATPTATTAPATATPTKAAIPAPPATGSGSISGGPATIGALVFGLVAMAIGGGLLFGVRRRI